VHPAPRQLRLRRGWARRRVVVRPRRRRVLVVEFMFKMEGKLLIQSEFPARLVFCGASGGL
jgi:hypothetical protein